MQSKNLYNIQPDPACVKTEMLFHEYIDGTLSARRIFDVEKHLTACPACSSQLQTLRDTLQMAKELPRLDTSNDFMAQLHARLDTLPSEPSQNNHAFSLNDVWLRLTSLLRPVPALGASLAVAVLLMFTLMHRPAPAAHTLSAAASAQVHQAVAQHLMQDALDPLSDPAADQLAINSSQSAQGTAN